MAQTATLQFLKRYVSNGKLQALVSYSTASVDGKQAVVVQALRSDGALTELVAEVRGEKALHLTNFPCWIIASEDPLYAAAKAAHDLSAVPAIDAAEAAARAYSTDPATRLAYEVGILRAELRTALERCAVLEAECEELRAEVTA